MPIEQGIPAIYSAFEQRLVKEMLCHKCHKVTSAESAEKSQVLKVLKGHKVTSAERSQVLDQKQKETTCRYRVSSRKTVQAKLLGLEINERRS